MKRLAALIMAAALLTGCAASTDSVETATQAAVNALTQTQTSSAAETLSSAPTDAGTLQSEEEASVNTVTFGSYQGQDIDWYVLDNTDGKALLLSVHALDARPFSEEAATWDVSSIRTWLNDDFYHEAFNDTERQEILADRLNNGDDLDYGTSAGQNTEDHVFLLSASEAEKYLSKEETTTSPTDYALSQGAYTNGSGYCAWWLRSPGMNDDGPAYYSSQGDIGTRAHKGSENIIGVRPAMWVSSDVLG